MKKYNIFKVLGIVILVTMVLSYFIPQTTVSYGAVEKGVQNPVGFVDTISSFITSFNVFIPQFLLILAIGIFYRVLDKTGKYGELVNNLAASFNNSKKAFVVFSVLFFGLFTAIMGNLWAMLLFVPLFISVSKKIGYSSVSSIASTIGAIIIGFAGTFNTASIDQVLQTKPETNIIAKIVVCVIGLASLIVFILLNNKNKDTKEIKKVNGKYHILIVAFALMFVFIVLGMTPWNTYFGFSGFEDIFQDVKDFKLFKISLYNALIGSTVSAWGVWQLFDIIILIIINTIIISLVYTIKFNDLLEEIAASVKKSLPYALIVVIAGVTLVNVYTSGWFYTVINALSGTKFNLFTQSLVAALSSVVYPDYTYGTQFAISTVINSITSTRGYYSILQVVFNFIYTLFLLISPTSVLVLIFLHKNDVRYKEWIKYIYKFFLILLVLFLIILQVAYKGINVFVIIAFILLAVVTGILISKKVSKKEVKEVKKEEPKKVETKKEEVKKTTSKKTTTKKNSTKKK